MSLATVQRGGAGTLALAFVAGAILLCSSAASAQQTIATRDEALAAVYPGAEIASGRVYLTRDQADRIEELSGEKVPSRIIARYVAEKDGAVVGRSYVDTHVVRTKKESLLISLDAGGAVLRIDVTAFLEPPEYIAQEQWRQQYREKALSRDLQLGRSIRPVAGATLTARAINSAVRRILALDQVVAD